MSNCFQAEPRWEFSRGTGPVIITAIHAGHRVRPELADLYGITDDQRLREEDPFTDRWVDASGRFGRVVVHRSRFECDMNRPRSGAVYRTPKDAWGLPVWREELPEEIVARSVELYDSFYRDLEAFTADCLTRFSRLVILDLHSYNHRRGGPHAPAAPPELNPDYNLGTDKIKPRERWVPWISGAMEYLRTADACGRPPVTGENIRFGGGHMNHWLHETFPGRVCVLSLEVKKFFMDEWTGEPDEACIGSVGRTVRGLAEVMEEMVSG